MASKSAKSRQNNRAKMRKWRKNLKNKPHPEEDIIDEVPKMDLQEEDEYEKATIEMERTYGPIYSSSQI